MAVTVTVGCFDFQQTLAARFFHGEDDDGNDMMEEEPSTAGLGVILTVSYRLS